MRCLIHDFAGHPFQVQLSRQLVLHGHTVTHAYSAGMPGPKGRLARSASDLDRFSVVPISVSGEFHKYSPLRRFIAHREYGNDLRKLIASEAPDVVLSGNTPTDIQAELLRCCRKLGIGFVHWVQDVYCRAVEFFLRTKLGALSKVLAAPLKRLEKIVAARSDAVIVVSTEFRDVMLDWEIQESKLTVIENWAPLEEVPLVARDNAWSRSHLLGAKTIFLYSGTLGVKHRPHLLYVLAERLGARCQVVVLTEGFGRDYLEKLPPLENLVILGFQPYESLPEVLASADVLLATLEADAGQFAVPSKILTYLCAGRPILLAGPRNNLAAHIIERSQAGVVVDPQDSEAWLHSAQALLADPVHRAELGMNGRRYAEQTFDIAEIATRFERVFATALGKSAQTASSSALSATSEN